MVKTGSVNVFTRLVLPVVGGATAVLTFGLVLVGEDYLTQVAEVADHRPHKLCACRRRRRQRLEVTGSQWSSSHFLSSDQLTSAASGAAVMMELLDCKRGDGQVSLRKQEVQAAALITDALMTSCCCCWWTPPREEEEERGRRRSEGPTDRLGRVLMLCGAPCRFSLLTL